MADNAAAVVERFLEAYNAQDFDAMRALLAPDLRFAHFGEQGTIVEYLDYG